MDWNMGSFWESPILAEIPRWIVTWVQSQIGPYLIASKILILEEYNYLMVMWWIFLDSESCQTNLDLTIEYFTYSMVG